MTTRDEAVEATARAMFLSTQYAPVRILEAEWEDRTASNDKVHRSYVEDARVAFDAVVKVLAGQVRELHWPCECHPESRCSTCGDIWPCETELLMREWVQK